jgi:hypothetical protein
MLTAIEVARVLVQTGEMPGLEEAWAILGLID